MNSFEPGEIVECENCLIELEVANDFPLSLKATEDSEY